MAVDMAAKRFDLGMAEWEETARHIVDTSPQLELTVTLNCG